MPVQCEIKSNEWASRVLEMHVSDFFLFFFIIRQKVDQGGYPQYLLVSLIGQSIKFSVDFDVLNTRMHNIVSYEFVFYREICSYVPT